MRVYLSDSKIANMKDFPLKEFSPNPRIYLMGFRASIMDWLYNHKSLKVKRPSDLDTGGRTAITVKVYEKAKTFGQEYSKALAMGIAGEGEAAHNIAASIYDAASSVGPSTLPRLKGPPSWARKRWDHITRTKYVVTLDCSGNLHPNPHANESLLDCPTNVAGLIATLEGMSW